MPEQMPMNRRVQRAFVVSLFFLVIALQAAQVERPIRYPTFPEFTCTPQMTFCNRAKEAGFLASKHYGRGTAVADIDGDGWEDVFLADTDNRWDPENTTVSMFFMNKKDGTFTARRATDLGIDSRDLIATWNGSFADVDNDGDPDFLLANGGYSGRYNLAFYENRIAQTGLFIPMTTPSGIDVVNTAPYTWWGSSWADYDNDGLLDVVVTRTEGTPVLFHNKGNGKFEEVAAAMGVTLKMDDGKNPVWIDYNGDGYPDLYLAGILTHAFYRNDGGKKFTDITSEIFPKPMPLGPTAPAGNPPFVFAAAAADFNQDGLDDLWLGRWNFQDLVLINDGKGKFIRHGEDWGIRTSLQDDLNSTAPFENTMGLGVLSLRDDGFPDVFIGTGDPSRTGADIIFCNKAGKGFERCTDKILTGADRVWRTRGHGTVSADFDHDGDSDILINLGGHPTFDKIEGRISPEWPAYFVNQGPKPNTATLELVGTKSNRDAIGARIRVSGSADHFYTVRSMQGFQSQNPKTQLVTLGSQSTARVEIHWPAGGRQVLTVKAGDRITVREE